MPTLEARLASPKPPFECLLAEAPEGSARRPVGFALFFQTYSTWKGHPGMWLEDLFVLPEARIDYGNTDLLVVTSKLFSRAQGRWVDLSKVRVSETARVLAEETGKDPSLVRCILDESSAVSHKAPGMLIVHHRLGFVSANAGIDASNALPAGTSPKVTPGCCQTAARSARERPRRSPINNAAARLTPTP